MPRTASRALITDAQRAFTGGLNTQSSEFLTEPTQVRVAQNAILTQYGDIQRRLGTRAISTGLPDATIQTVFCWRTATTHEYLVASNNRLYSLGTYSSSMAATDKGALLATRPGIVAFRDGAGEVAYIGSGTQLYKYTGGVLTAVAGTPALTVLAVYNQRLFGITGTDQTIHYSSLNNGDSCGVVSGTSGSAIVRTFGNQKLTALLTLKNSLALFHVTGVSRFTGLTQDDIAIGSGAEGIATETGTVAPGSVVAVEGMGYFLSERGAFAITDDGVVALDSPSTPDPTVSALAAMSASNLLTCNAVHDKATRSIRFRLPGIGAYAYHYRLRAWSGPHTREWTSASALAEGIDDTGAPIMVGSGIRGFTSGTDANTAGQLRRFDSPTTYKDNVRVDGTAGFTIDMVVKFRRFLTAEPENEKAWRQAYLFFDLGTSTTAKLYWQTSALVGDGPVAVPPTGFTTSAFTIDLSALTGETLWGAGTWGAFDWADSVTERPIAVPLCGRGTYLDLLFADSSASAIRLSRVDIDAYDYGIRF